MRDGAKAGRRIGPMRDGAKAGRRTNVVPTVVGAEDGIGNFVPL